ncbi:MAG: hypothetical protein V1718_05090 [archaeon]
MGLFVAVAMAVVLAFLACIAVMMVLARFVNKGAFLFLLVAVLGVPVSGTLLSFVVFVFPDVIGTAGCFLYDIGLGVPILLIIFMSYYMCALVLGFLRFREDKLKGIRKRKKKR